MTIHAKANAVWTVEQCQIIYNRPLPDLLFEAQSVHRQNFDPNEIEMATLLSIKTGGCPEDCGYCSQSAHHKTGLRATKLMALDDVLAAARKAKEGGATRFCMGAAWRSPKDRDMDSVCSMIEGVHALGMETCVTLGMLTEAQSERLAEAGLDYYNHNVDTSPEFYPNIVTTRSMDDRLETLQRVRASGIKVCSGGIVGMGETVEDRISMLVLLANLSPQPESVPLNLLNEIKGTPVAATAQKLDPLSYVRLVALARIMMPTSVIRLSAGRDSLTDEAQALCFFAGANSIFTGATLLTTGNPEREKDEQLLAALGMHQAMPRQKNRATDAASLPAWQMCGTPG